MPEAIWISFAFGLGLLIKSVGLPPLVGYLAACFVLSGLASSPSIGISAEPTAVLAHHRRQSSALCHHLLRVYPRPLSADGRKLVRSIYAGCCPVFLIDCVGREGTGKQARTKGLSRPGIHRHSDHAGFDRTAGNEPGGRPDTFRMGIDCLWFTTAKAAAIQTAGCQWAR